MSPRDLVRFKLALSEAFAGNKSIKELERTLEDRKIIKPLYDYNENGVIKDADGNRTMLMDVQSRSHIIARTESNRMANLGAIDNFKELGVKEVKWTAGMDDRTCEICSELNGTVYSISDDAVITGAPTYKIDGGAAQHVGTTTTLVDNLKPGLGTPNSLSVIVTGIGNGHDLAKSVVAGTNAGELEAGYYIMQRGGAYTEHIHGDTGFTKLRSGGNTVRDSIHRKMLVRGTLTATSLRANKWNQITGAWDSGYPIADTSGLYSISANDNTTSGEADQAALPSGAIPGELVYKEPKLTPVQDDYKARYLW